MEDILEVLFNELTASENVLSNELTEMKEYKEKVAELLVLEEELSLAVDDKELANAYDIKRQEIAYITEYAIFKIAFKMGGRFLLEFVYDKETPII